MPVTDGRHHIDSPLWGMTLQRRDTLATTDGLDRAILTDDLVCFIAGCVFDAGADELHHTSEIIRKQESALVVVGDGERSRHVAGIALDCGCPTGVIAQVVASCEEMNATVMSAVLAPRGCFIPRDEIWHVPFLLQQGMLPIMLAVPPYSLWETPTDGDLPEHGSAFGADRLAEALGFGDLIEFHADACDGC